MSSVKLFGREIDLNQKFNLELTGDITVDEAGRNKIRTLLREHTGLKKTLPSVEHPTDEMPKGWDWHAVVQSGPYRGKFANRVSAFFKKNHDITLTKELLADIGNIAAAHMSKPQFIVADITDKFNWDRGDFGDQGSCYWSSRAEDKEIIRFHGTMALRFYTDRGAGYARCWLIPNAPTDDSFIIFNGYGIQGDATLSMAQFISRWLGAEYKRIGLTVMKRSEGTVFINNGAGYLVGNAELTKNTTAHDLRWTARFPKCCHCERRAKADEDATEHMLDGNFYCQMHWDSYVVECGKCHNHRMDRSQRSRYIYGGPDDRSPVCMECYDAAPKCEGCDHHFLNADPLTLHEHIQWQRGDVREHMILCPECVTRLVTCEDCGKKFATNSMGVMPRHYCDECAETRARIAREEKEKAIRAIIEERRKMLAAARAAADEMDTDVVETREFLGAEGVLFTSDKNGNIIDRVTLDLPQL